MDIRTPSEFIQDVEGIIGGFIREGSYIEGLVVQMQVENNSSEYVASILLDDVVEKEGWFIPK